MSGAESRLDTATSCVGLLVGLVFFLALIWSAREGDIAWTVAFGALLVNRSIDALRTDLMKRASR